MSKIFTKVFSLVIAVAIISSGFSVNASASELKTQKLGTNESENLVFSENQGNVGVNGVGPGQNDENLIVPYGTSKPTSTWNLATKGQYAFSGTINSSGSLYTNYLFTGVSSATISVTNSDHQYSTKFKVMKKGSLWDSSVGSYEVEKGKSATVSVTLDKSSQYYIQFQGPTSFRGYIK